MMQHVMIFLYVVFGVILKEHNIITEPAYWSLYGFVCGAFVTTTLLMDTIRKHQ